MYIREASEILGINKILSETLTGNDQKITSKRVLDYVTRNLIEWKKSTAGIVRNFSLIFKIFYNFVLYNSIRNKKKAKILDFFLKCWPYLNIGLILSRVSSFLNILSF